MSEQPVNPVIVDLQHYIAAMAPHQKERMGGRLLVRAKEEIERLLRLNNEQLETLGVKEMAIALERIDAFGEAPPNGYAARALLKYRAAQQGSAT